MNAKIKVMRQQEVAVIHYFPLQLRLIGMLLYNFLGWK